MQLPSYKVEFLPLERRLLERRYTMDALRDWRREHRCVERRQVTENGDPMAQFTRLVL